MMPNRPIPQKRLMVAIARLGLTIGLESGARADDSEPGITDGFLATGGATFIRDGQCKIVWRFPPDPRWLGPA